MHAVRGESRYSMIIHQPQKFGHFGIHSPIQVPSFQQHRKVRSFQNYPNHPDIPMKTSSNRKNGLNLNLPSLNSNLCWLNHMVSWLNISKSYGFMVTNQQNAGLNQQKIADPGDLFPSFLSICCLSPPCLMIFDDSSPHQKPRTPSPSPSPHSPRSCSTSSGKLARMADGSQTKMAKPGVREVPGIPGVPGITEVKFPAFSGWNPHGFLVKKKLVMVKICKIHMFSWSFWSIKWRITSHFCLVKSCKIRISQNKSTFSMVYTPVFMAKSSQIPIIMLKSC